MVEIIDKFLTLKENKQIEHLGETLSGKEATSLLNFLLKIQKSKIRLHHSFSE